MQVKKLSKELWRNVVWWANADPKQNETQAIFNENAYFPTDWMLSLDGTVHIRNY